MTSADSVNAKSTAKIGPSTPVHATQEQASLWSWEVIRELTRFRLTLLVLVATASGYLLAVGNALLLEPSRFGSRIGVLFATMIGTALVSAGASIFNQVWERRIDARMKRTETRPLATGQIPPTSALVLAVVVTAAGLSLLCGTSNSLAALLALASLLLYVLIYTPLKTRITQNTLVGAIPGAIPPLIGWAAFEGRLGNGAWTLFAILFLWQVPHFLAIAWMHRHDYANAGFRMLPIEDEDGSRTARMALLYSLALIPASLAAPLSQLGSTFYVVSATILGLVFAGTAVAFAMKRTEQRARRLFLASISYLPALLLIMILDAPRLS